MSLAADPQRRAEILASAQQLIDYLRANEDVPIWHYGLEIQFGPDDGREGVAQIGRQLGERPELLRTTGTYRVRKQFGRAAYVAFSRPRAQQQPAVQERRAAA